MNIFSEKTIDGRIEPKIFDNVINVVSPIHYQNQSLLDYDYFKKFQKETLNKYEILNEEEVLRFIMKYPSLIKLIEIFTSLIVENFNGNKLTMDFFQDPEIGSFQQIVIYIHSSDESFDKDWEILKRLNTKINQIDFLDNSMKRLLTVDLW